MLEDARESNRENDAEHMKRRCRFLLSMFCVSYSQVDLIYALRIFGEPSMRVHTKILSTQLRSCYRYGDLLLDRERDRAEPRIM